MNGHPLQWSVCMLADSGLRVESRDAERPVLVVSREIANDALPIVTVLPLAKHTPGRQVYPNEVLLVAQSTELDWAAIAMAHQIRTVPKGRLSTAAGNVSDPEVRSAIRRALRVQLDLDPMEDDDAARGE